MGIKVKKLSMLMNNQQGTKIYLYNYKFLRSSMSKDDGRTAMKLLLTI
jgi:hypothetical protein